MNPIEYDQLFKLVSRALEKNEKIISSANPPEFIEIYGELFHTSRFKYINFDYSNIDLIVRNLHNRKFLREKIINDLNAHKELLKENPLIPHIEICRRSYIKNNSFNENSTIDQLLNEVEVMQEISNTMYEERERSEQMREQIHMNRINDGYYNSYDD